MTFLTLPQHPLGRSQQPFGLDYASAGDPSHPAVMLVMGLGTQRTAWPEELIQALVRQGYRVVSFDNRDEVLLSAVVILASAKSHIFCLPNSAMR